MKLLQPICLCLTFIFFELWPYAYNMSLKHTNELLYSQINNLL